MSNFEGVWLDIRRHLKVGTEVQGWSRDKGYTTTRFEIVDVSPASITISSSTVSQPRPIAKSDCAKVYELWAD